jgi:hypothetical protein
MERPGSPRTSTSWCCPKDALRAKEIAKALGFKAESLPMRYKATGELQRVIKFSPSGEILCLDLLVVGEELQPVWQSRQKLSAAGGELWVVSRPGLMSMKLAAGRPQDLLDARSLSESE